MIDIADICLISEGSYPYVKGGVASCIHDMVSEMKEYKFHILSVMAPSQEAKPFYAMPANVIQHTTHRLGDLPHGRASRKVSKEMHERLRPLLMGLIDGVPFERETFFSLLRVLSTYRNHLSERSLLNSKDAWDTMITTYESGYSHLSFLDFFWAYRSILSTMASALLFPLPVARVYHSVSTGYAGLLSARGKYEAGAPVLLTEHGIYTNERRIEIVAAEWLQQHRAGTLSVDTLGDDLRYMWVRYFEQMGRTAYEASDKIISLFRGAQTIQLSDGAAVDKCSVIPNGIDVERFAALPRTPHANPTVALVGRVVPIKDVKTFIHAVAMIAKTLPTVQALIIGPTDEDTSYAKECQNLVASLGMENTIKFLGMVSVDQHYPMVDVVVLTSISEGQPLVLLEAGAAGIPVIATDVGACREMIEGMQGENPAFGSGGIVTALANPQATAQAMYALLTDRERYNAASWAIKSRVAAVYPKEKQFDAYRELYQLHLR
jgi:polysaccharide biosynthesis protein PelF